MLDLTLNQLLGTIPGVVALVFSIFLFRSYMILHYIDYLLFSLFFFTGFIILIFDPLASIFEMLVFYQIHHIAIDTGYLLLAIHALRIRWKKIPRSLLAISVLWWATLITLTLLWHEFTQPDSAIVFFFELPHTFSSYFPSGAGLTLENGVIIYSTAYRYIGEFYRIFTLLLLIFAYTTFKPVGKPENIRKGRAVWLTIWIFLLIHAFSLFPWLNVTEIVSIFLLVIGGILAYILLRMPEFLLLSESQIQRFQKLYETFENQQVELQKWFFKDELSFKEFLGIIEHKNKHRDG